MTPTERDGAGYGMPVRTVCHLSASSMNRILAILNRTETAVSATADLLAARIGLADIHVLHPRPSVDPGFR